MREKSAKKQNIREKFVNWAYFDNKKKSFMISTCYI